jgi:hypothetical protein
MPDQQHLTESVPDGILWDLNKRPGSSMPMQQQLVVARLPSNTMMRLHHIRTPPADSHTAAVGPCEIDGALRSQTGGQWLFD